MPTHDQIGYSDADWAGDYDDKRSTQNTTSFLMELQQVGKHVSNLQWPSLCEAVYMVMVKAVKEACSYIFAESILH